MNEIDILKEINKNAKTGIDGLNFTLDKVQSDDLRDLLYKEMNMKIFMTELKKFLYKKVKTSKIQKLFKK